MSLPPPRSVAPKEEAFPVNMDTINNTTTTSYHYPSIASKISTTMGPPPSVSSYSHQNSVPPPTPYSAATPYTPRPVDVSHLQPSLQ